MLRDYNDTLYSTPIINAITLSNELECDQTKAAIRKLFFENFREKEGEPIINEYRALLNQLGIETILAKLPSSNLLDAPVPFLIMLDNNIGDFSCVTSIDKQTGELTINQSNIILKKDANRDFPESHYIVLLVSGVDRTRKDEYFDQYKEMERTKEERYKKSIRVIDDFLGPEECSEIINYCSINGGFKRSMVYNDGDVNGEGRKNKTIYSKDRTSTNMDLSGYGKIEDLRHKLYELLKCSMEQLEPLSCIRYEQSQHFKYHHDFIPGGDRLYTLVIYLNDDFEGGELRFPEIDMTYKSQSGSCIVFQNIDQNKELILESMHGSLPIIKGIKYAIPVFMHINPLD
jgi:hypothetical protein